MKTKKEQRITENIFDIVLNTSFKGEAEKQMRRDLYNTNVTCDKENGEIVISGKCLLNGMYIEKASYLDSYQSLLEDIAYILEFDRWYKEGFDESSDECIISNVDNPELLTKTEAK